MRAGPRRPEAGADLRSRLIRAGLLLVERTGAARLGLRLVAKQVGVSHMAPYVHFKNKSELLCAIAVAGFDMFRSELGKAMAPSGGRAVERFLGIGLAYVEFARKCPQLLDLMFGGTIPPAEHTPELTAARGAVFDGFVQFIDAAMASGEFRKGDPVAAAFAGWSIAHGFSRLSLGGEFRGKLGSGRAEHLGYARQVLSLLVSGVEASPDPETARVLAGSS